VNKLKIEKVVYGGDGLARVEEASGKKRAVFVPFVLPGEEIDALITERGRSFSRARVQSIAQASARRIEAKCPYFQRCGGCHYQHSDYEHQLEIKTQILRETLLRTAKFDWQQEIPVYAALERGEQWNYRNRTRMKVVQRDAKFEVGYYRHASHDLLPVEECPISSPLINRLLAEIWNLGRTGKVPGGIAEIEFFANAEDNAAMLELYFDGEWQPEKLEDFAGTLQKTGVTGVAAFAGMAARPAKQAWHNGAAELLYKTDADEYHVRAGSFFQTNRYLTDKLVKMVTADESGEGAFDLYAGVGLFTLPLARKFKRVMGVESGPASYADLRTNAPDNVECHRSTTQDFLAVRRSVRPELVVVDPPRAGLDDKVTTALVKMAAARMTYVSCDPATLARDLAALVSGGYKVKSVELVDLFPQTFHIETVVKLAR
jgi:23S rRNA (uracil1939-C5)-methyltransferase